MKKMYFLIWLLILSVMLAACTNPTPKEETKNTSEEVTRIENGEKEIKADDLKQYVTLTKDSISYPKSKEALIFADIKPEDIEGFLQRLLEVGSFQNNTIGVDADKEAYLFGDIPAEVAKQAIQNILGVADTAEPEANPEMVTVNKK